MRLLNFYIFTLLLNFTFTFAAFIPNVRVSHSSVLIDDKLYFSGGIKFHNDYDYDIFTNEFFYLNVSKPFTTTDNDSIQWADLTYTDGPMTDSATACIGGKNNDMIFIFGGITPLGVSQAFVNQFDTNKQQWINITSVDSTPTNRSLISCANFDNGLIAIFGGISNTSNVTNDLWIFNTLTLTWSLRNTTNAPLPMFGYCAVALPDGNILYLGGINYTPSTALYAIPMNNLPLYNTKFDPWTNMSISGPTPSGRRSFSAVLTSDGRIIIFGGSNAAGTVLGDLWILDITMFQWLIGKILNPIVNLTLKDHTATLVNNYMFVSFGRFGNYSESSRIFMLDVSQKDFYKWVTEFTPNTTTTTTFTATTIPTTTTTVTTNSNNTSSDSKNTSIIIGAIIGSIISLIIFVIASILTLKFIDKQM
ncbi:galactose oxidase [Gigaspora margarita]|uniref:Galactose oxidase n=1 Tax=Gigaspora margarita TaxID=4874 RepID=A0A8H4B5E1_GIGMA|nr:galactose oxidase [Gigaspora margarita]